MKDPNHANIIEVLGRNHPIAQLIEDNFHAAVPLWDQGVDLLAYDGRSGGLAARPLQLKVAEGSRWGVQTKYADIQGLFMVYIWHEKQDVQIYAMSYAEALNHLTITSTYAKSDRWTKRGEYPISPVGTDLLASLQPFLMAKGKWRKRLELP